MGPSQFVIFIGWIEDAFLCKGFETKKRHNKNKKEEKCAFTIVWWPCAIVVGGHHIVDDWRMRHI